MRARRMRGRRARHCLVVEAGTAEGKLPRPVTTRPRTSGVFSDSRRVYGLSIMRVAPHNRLLTSVLLLLAAVPTAEAAVQQRLTVHRDLVYAEHDRGKLDVYVPDGTNGAPVLVFVHGGGLMFGDKSLIGHLGLRLAWEGIVTVAVNHRFSPDVTHPRHVRDFAEALRWVVDEIAVYGGDPQRIVVAGHSSGGYLAALLAADPRWLAEVEVSRAHLAGLVSISGFHWVDRLAPSRPKHVWGEDPAAWPDASPAHRADAGTPPTLLLWADGDAEDRRVDGRDFGAVLEGLGVDVRTREIEGRDHYTIFDLLGWTEDPTAASLIEFVAEVTRRDRPEP